MGAYLVTAPYVTLKVKDVSGVAIVQGYYAGGVVQNLVEDEQFEKHVRNGCVEEAEEAPVEEPAEAPPAPEAPVFERPAGNASQEAWAIYALESGQASEDEVRDLSRDELRELYG